MHWRSFKICPPGKMVFRLMVIAEITTWWKILSNPSRSISKMPKTLNSRKEEELQRTLRSVKICIFCIILVLEVPFLGF